MDLANSTTVLKQQVKIRECRVYLIYAVNLTRFVPVGKESVGDATSFFPVCGL
jgi:hypothetical protein